MVVAEASTLIVGRVSADKKAVGLDAFGEKGGVGPLCTIPSVAIEFHVELISR